MSLLAAVSALPIRLLGELVAPSTCAACDVPVRARVLFCMACALSLERMRDPGTASIAVFEHGGAMATAIAALKYKDRPDLGPRLGEALAPAVHHLRGRIDAVVPVPLHPRRLAERGYNQALLLAAPVARALGAPLAPRVVLRCRDTSQQASLDRQQRLANIAAAFVTNGPIEPRRILLVDDVRTTGATIAACAAALRAAGAMQVYDLVVAHRV